jgi:hypothetical protein
LPAFCIGRGRRLACNPNKIGKDLTAVPGDRDRTRRVGLAPSDVPPAPPDATTRIPPTESRSYPARAPSPSEPPRAERRAGGPGGCLLGCLAFLLIGAVAGLVVWPLVARPILRDAARDRLRDRIVVEVEAVDDLPVLPSGELVVTEDEINAYLEANPDAYDPVEDPEVDITPDRIRLRFTLYGTDNAYTGRPEVRGGRVVVVDGDLDGPAARVLTDEDVAALVGEQLAALLAKSGLRPTAVDLDDDSLTISTTRASSRLPSR